MADDPPAPVVERVAKAFREKEGDLAHVARVLVESPEAWQGGMAKLKTPEEYVISAARALQVDELEASALHRSLAQMGQRPYWAPSPAGWPVSTTRWDARRTRSAGGPRASLERARRRRRAPRAPHSDFRYSTRSDVSDCERPRTIFES